MRILIIASFADSILDFRGQLISSMQAAGADVHVAAPELAEKRVIAEQLRAKGAQVHNIPLRRNGMNPMRDIALVFFLVRLMLRIGANVVLTYPIKPVIYGTLAAWIVGVPYRFALVTGLGYAFAERRHWLLTGLVQRLYAVSLRRNHKVFFQNPDDEAFFRQCKVLADSTKTVIVNGSGVDLKMYAAHPLPDGAPRFLLIARLLGDKGVREYAEAAGRVRVRHPDVCFGLVGWIDSNPAAISQEELDAWISEGCIHFYGRLDDVRPAIAECSIYVLPSYREGTPRTVLEAMAMGRAIITTDAPGCRETVIEGDNGFLVRVKSVDDLEKAMLKFVEQRSLAAQMGRSSRRIAENKYDVHKVNSVMLREMGVL